LRIDYLLPAPCEDLFFDATIVHRSKKLVRVDASCWNNDRTRQVAIGRGLFSVCERSAEEEVPKPVAE
jgi:acyl-coenzyme A thioesterase PaaI-like protein